MKLEDVPQVPPSPQRIVIDLYSLADIELLRPSTDIQNSGVSVSPERFSIALYPLPDVEGLLLNSGHPLVNIPANEIPDQLSPLPEDLVHPTTVVDQSQSIPEAPSSLIQHTINLYSSQEVDRIPSGDSQSIQLGSEELEENQEVPPTPEGTSVNLHPLPDVEGVQHSGTPNAVLQGVDDPHIEREYLQDVSLHTSEDASSLTGPPPESAVEKHLSEHEFEEGLELFQAGEPMPSASAASDDILYWTSQDPRESMLFNSWGVLYRFKTTVKQDGSSATTMWRTLRPNKEDRIAKLEWAPNGGLGHVIMGKHTLPMGDLVKPDAEIHGSRGFTGPDGLQYRWRPSSQTQDIVLQDAQGETIAFFRPIRQTRYQIGDVYGELHFLRNAGSGTVMHPPMQDMVTLTAMLYRFCSAWNL